MTEAEAPQTPSMGTPLTDLVSGAPGLIRALQGVSVIDEAEGDEAQALLKPGQALVSKSGMLWRWDGLIRKGEVSSEAERIRQRQRLSHLTQDAETQRPALQINKNPWMKPLTRIHKALPTIVICKSKAAPPQMMPIPPGAHLIARRWP